MNNSLNQSAFNIETRLCLLNVPCYDTRFLFVSLFFLELASYQEEEALLVEGIHPLPLPKPYTSRTVLFIRTVKSKQHPRSQKHGFLQATTFNSCKSICVDDFAGLLSFLYDWVSSCSYPSSVSIDVSGEFHDCK